MERRIFCTFTFVVGLLLTTVSPAWKVVLLVGVALGVVWREPLRTRASLLLVLVSLLFGVSRGVWDGSGSPSSLPERGRGQVLGTILEPPRRWGASSVFFLRVEELDGSALLEPVKILVQWRQCEEDLAPGDRWLLEGQFMKGEGATYPGAFSQREWLWCQRVESVFRMNRFSGSHYLGPPEGLSPHQMSYRARNWMMRRLSELRDERVRALVAGVVFGETQSLPKDLQEQFRRTGTSHLLAASGMNVALLAGLILGVGRWVGLAPWRVAPLALPPVIGYVFLAGCGPSITRAGVGASLTLLALLWGRRNNAWNTLSLSVWALLLWDPRQLYDVGFQLSVAAVVGLGAGPEAPRKGGYVTSALVLTSSACFVTLPIFWATFGELSTTLLPANLLLGPLVELLFPLGLLVSIFPVAPLYWLIDGIARVSLWLVAKLSLLASPILLAPPNFGVWILSGAAVGTWYFSSRWNRRLLAFLLLAGAVGYANLVGTRPQARNGELVVRRVGAGKPVYWISSHTREILILSEPWQESRARAMLRKLGCLTAPELHFLPPGEALDLKWGELDWRRLEPCLEKAPYLELRAGQTGYKVRTWWPE